MLLLLSSPRIVWEVFELWLSIPLGVCLFWGFPLLGPSADLSTPLEEYLLQQSCLLLRYRQLFLVSHTAESQLGHQHEPPAQIPHIQP